MVNLTSTTKHKPYPAYQPSSVEWLGDIPEHWEAKKLKYLSNISISSVDKHTNENETPVALCNYTDVYYSETISLNSEFMKATATEHEIENFTLRKSDVLLTKDSETWEDIAVPAFVPTDMNGVLCGYHLALVRPISDGIEGKYLFYMFKSTNINHEYRISATGITRYGLGKGILENSVFLIPSLPEQRSIANFLDHQTTEIDALIGKKERLIELLEEKRTALISQVVTKGLNPDVAMKDSEILTIGEIPSHWTVEKNKKLYYEYQDRSETGDEELLTVSHITGITPRSEKEVNMFMAESMEGYKRCFLGDLVINTMWAWMGALGISNYIGIVSPSYHVYRLKNMRLFNPKYLDFFYRTPEYIVEINRYSKGVWKSRLRLYPSEFFEMTTLVPPKEEQDQIVAFLDQELLHRDKLINVLQNSIELLHEQRTALISAAVSGKIDVREWELS